MASSSAGTGQYQGQQRMRKREASSDESAWETAQERSSTRQEHSSSVPENLSSSVVIGSDQGGGSSSTNQSINTRRLWAAVKTSAKLAAIPRKVRDEPSSNFDDEGMSDPSDQVRSRLSGTYLNQWNSIAHFLDNDEGEDKGLFWGNNVEQPPHKRERPDRTMLPDGVARLSITQEPESMLNTDPDSIPTLEDPLAYQSGTQLLDTDNETEEDAYESCTESGEGKAVDQSIWSRFGQQVFQKRPSLFTKTVMKCVLAYFLASLFTYSPYLSHKMAQFLPDHDDNKKVPISNLHLIATVAVYFHPGRSMGSMVEASIYALAGFLYSIFIGLASMLVAVLLHDQGFPVTSNVITVVVFIGLAMALVGYAKVKIGRPNFNTACSLIGVLSFTVIVTEGSTHLGRFSTEKIWQVTLVVFIGVLISNLVCFLIWPTSACTSLQQDINRNLKSFSTLLKVLTKTFLLDDVKEFNIRSHRIKEAVEDHHASFISLKKNLSEAKLEVPFDIRMRGRVSSYVQVVDSLNVLAQHLGGLRSSCSLQSEMILAQRARQKMEAMSKNDKDTLQIPGARSIPSNLNDSTYSFSQSMEVDEQFPAFRQFLGSVGPHMRSLVFTCSRTLKHLTSAFAVDKIVKENDQAATAFENLGMDVSTALKRFQHEQTVAI